MLPSNLDIDVEHRPGVGVLVAADDLPGAPVDVGEPVDPAPHEHRVHRRGGAMFTAAPIATGPNRLRHRRCTIVRTTGAGVRVGLRWGRFDRSAMSSRLTRPSGDAAFAAA